MKVFYASAFIACLVLCVIFGSCRPAKGPIFKDKQEETTRIQKVSEVTANCYIISVDGREYLVNSNGGVVRLEK